MRTAIHIIAQVNQYVTPRRILFGGVGDAPAQVFKKVDAAMDIADGVNAYAVGNAGGSAGEMFHAVIKMPCPGACLSGQHQNISVCRSVFSRAAALNVAAESI